MYYVMIFNERGVVNEKNMCRKLKFHKIEKKKVFENSIIYYDQYAYY